MSGDEAPVEAGLVERLRKLPNPFTRLAADYLPDGVDELEIEPGWRIHDFPDAPNPHGVWIANHLCDGLGEDQAKYIVEAVNALPALLFADRENSELLEAAIEGQSYWQARAEKLSEAVEPFRLAANRYWRMKEHGASEQDAADEAFDIISIDEIVGLASALADAQPTQEEGK